MLCCGITRTKFMDSLYFCFIAHLSLTHCYSLCSQWVHYCWLSISPFSKKRLILVRWLSSSWMDVMYISIEFSKGKPIITSHWRIKQLMFSCLLTHNQVLHRSTFKSKKVIWPRIQSWSLCICILQCKMLYKNVFIPASQHKGWVALYLCFENTSLTLKIPLCFTLSCGSW